MLTVSAYVAPSPIHGLGLFAGERIAAGRMWWEMIPGIDDVKSSMEVSRLLEPAREFWWRYAFKRSRDGALVLCFDHARFVNHSDHPNSSEDGDGNSIALVDIDPGTEITENYLSF